MNVNGKRKKNQVVTANIFEQQELLKKAETKTSTRGEQNKKIVVVKPYTKSNGTKVGGHRRSTPN